MPDRYDEDYKDESKTNARLTGGKIDIPGGGFGADEKVDGSSDHPRDQQIGSGTMELYTLADNVTAKAMSVFSGYNLFNTADYRTVLEAGCVRVDWFNHYRNRWFSVAELPVEDSEELRRIFDHEPLRFYIADSCHRRTPHILYFKEHGHGTFAYEKLLCIAWQHISRLVRPGAAFNFYRTVAKHHFMDAKRDGGRKIRMKGRYRELTAPEGAPKTILVKRERPPGG